MKTQSRIAQIRRLNATDRRITAVASTEALDATNTIVRANWDLRRFLTNPVLLFNGDDCALPVGQCQNLRVEAKSLVFEAVFDDITEADRDIWVKYQRGTMRGFSVGFRPIEQRTIEVEGRTVTEYLKSELLEISCAVLPMNPEALRRSAGRDEQPLTGASPHKETSTMNRGLSAAVAAIHRRLDNIEGRDTARRMAEVISRAPAGTSPQLAAAVAETGDPEKAARILRAVSNSQGHSTAGANAIDRVLGIPRTPHIAIGEVNPATGVRSFSGMTPQQARALTKRAA